MKQLFGYADGNYYAFLPSNISSNVADMDCLMKNQGMTMSYYAGERRACADILLVEQNFQSDFNDERVEDMKKYLIDRKVTGLDTINPDWEICVDYTIFDNTGRIVSGGINRIDAVVANVKIPRAGVGNDNELVYTYGMKANGYLTINVGQQASYGLKKVDSIYPIQLVINKIYVQGNTYAATIISRMNKMRAARFSPDPHRRHSDLLTDPRYYYDRYPHHCAPPPPIDPMNNPIPCAPNFPPVEGNTTYDSRYTLDEYGRPIPNQPVCCMNDYIPGPLPYVDHYSPVPDPHSQFHPMWEPLPPRYYNGVDHRPVFRYMSCAQRKLLEEKYRVCPSYQAPRITLYEISGKSLKYNGLFRQEVQTIGLNLSIVLDNFALVGDDQEIIDILKQNNPTCTGDGCCCDPHKTHDCGCGCDCCKPNPWAFYTGLVWQDPDSNEWPYENLYNRVEEWFKGTNSKRKAPVAKFNNKDGSCTVSGNYGNPIFMWVESQGSITDIKDKNGDSILEKFITEVVIIDNTRYTVYILNGESGGVDATSTAIDYTLVWKE